MLFHPFQPCRVGSSCPHTDFSLGESLPGSSERRAAMKLPVDRCILVEGLRYWLEGDNGWFMKQEGWDCR